jgi:hypothetical protein
MGNEWVHKVSGNSNVLVDAVERRSNFQAFALLSNDNHSYKDQTDHAETCSDKESGRGAVEGLFNFRVSRRGNLF